MRIIEVALTGTVGTHYMGPVSTAICEISNRFAARGHEVVVVDVEAENPRTLLHPQIRLLEVQGIPQSRVAQGSTNAFVAHFRRWRNYYRCMAELVSHSLRSDVVHFHAPQPAYLAQRLFGMHAVFYTAHTPTWSMAAPARRSPIGRLMTSMERAVVRRSRLTVGFGAYLAAAVPGANIVTIPNGLDLDSWPALDRIAARRALGIPPEAFVPLFAGRIDRVKGIDTLLDAIGQLAPKLPRLQAYVIGPFSGSFDLRDEFVTPFAQEMLERARKLPVRFLGFIGNRDPEFRQYLAAADVFVLPSRTEPQGLVVLEALAMGTPVIGSSTGGIPDMVTDDVGYLFPPTDAAALAARIRASHDDAEGLRARQAAARERVRLLYSWEGTADRYLAEFKQHTRSAAQPPRVAQAPVRRSL